MRQSWIFQNDPNPTVQSIKFEKSVGLVSKVILKFDLEVWHEDVKWWKNTAKLYVDLKAMQIEIRIKTKVQILGTKIWI